VSRDELHPLVMATLTEIQAAFARLARRQKRMTVMVKPHSPPQTAREVLALFVPDHGNHSVAEYEAFNRRVSVVCSCGSRVVVDDDAAKVAGCTLRDVKAALDCRLRSR